MIRNIFVMMSALLISGCATLPSMLYEEPVVTFKDLRVEGIGLSGGALDVVLNVYNPNQFDLHALKLSYRLLVDSTILGEGIYDSKFTVRTGDTTTVHLPISLTYSGLSVAARQLLGRGTVDYNVAGTLSIDTPVGEFNIPYSRTGRFNNLGTSLR